jgi:hypothetical protein
MRSIHEPRIPEADGDYRVKIFKAVARSAHDEVERARAVLAEQWAAVGRRAEARRHAELRRRSGAASA